ncbi:MAG TPA: LLM class flavin-dependent oxidoreductase [Candidatus Dormibacteraeota bacterium]|nr:LLM class flavin-dependent oxidoreductase [Candidatus Dormibacteraeota bacterium]
MGYEAICANDTPAGDGLALVAAWAHDSQRIDLGVGVLALDRYTPDDISSRVEALDLPHHRLVLGVGAGFIEEPVAAVREGVGALRQLLPDVRIIVAAMGPRMCQLAGEIGDGALLNWMTPERATWARDLVVEGANRVGRDLTEITIYGYVRVALGPDARERLEREASFYMQMPHYARHFEASGGPPGGIGVAASDADDLKEQLQHYFALDVPVVRVLSERDVDTILEVARAAIE